MPALDEYLQQKISILDHKHLLRTLKTTQRECGVRVMRHGKELISFSCNDYLGLSHHPKVMDAAKAAVDANGAGAGASRLITGNTPLYDELESALADYKNTEAACVFGSGYLANLGAIPALVGKGDLIIADKLVHACMVDAARLSGATVMRFAHNNMEHARMLLEGNRGEHHHCLILSETIFSMDGDRAPLQILKRLASEFDAWLMVDDAHGTGWLKSEPVDILMGTLSKGLGSYGGYVCGSKPLIDYLKTSARSLIFSTGLPPAALAAAIASLSILKEDPTLTAKPLENARLFTSLVGLPSAQSPIVPLVIGENDAALNASALLESKGFLVTAIRPPTVPENTARLRFAFSALHTLAQIEAVAAIIKEQGWAGC
jgi:8-amino-7-oxononanoate synthase